MDKRYIKFFDGYRAAYGLADFEHEEAVVDPESGKKKPVYRWNYEPLTEKVYQAHLNGKLSIGCRCLKISNWLSNFEEIGKAEGYSENEIKEYYNYIKLAESFVTQQKQTQNKPESNY